MRTIDSAQDPTRKRFGRGFVADSGLAAVCVNYTPGAHNPAAIHEAYVATKSLAEYDEISRFKAFDPRHISSLAQSKGKLKRPRASQSSTIMLLTFAVSAKITARLNAARFSVHALRSSRAVHSSSDRYESSD